MAVTYYDANGKEVTKKEFVAILREKYMQNPPDGYTRREIERMRDNGYPGYGLLSKRVLKILLNPSLFCCA